MKIISLFLILWSLLGQPEHLLQITFSGLESSNGYIMVMLTDAEGSVITKKKIPAHSPETQLQINLPPGQYTIAAYHDKNGNEKLDKNFIGAPKEIYGFSNNARGVFGPPDLDEQLFELDGNLEVNIRLH